jgi:Lon-like protease
MLKLLKKYQKLIIVLIFPYLYLMMVLVVPTNYSVTAPGDLTPVDQFITIDGVESVGDFNTFMFIHMIQSLHFSIYALQ